MDHCDQKVTVIGGGVIGVCCALSLLEKGFQVRLIDQGQLQRKASYGNAGVISPWSCVPQSMPGLWTQIPSLIMGKNAPVSFRWGYLAEFLPWAMKFIASGEYSKVTQISKAMDALNRPNLGLYYQYLANTGREDLIKDACYVHLYRNKEDLSTESLDYQLRSEKQAPLEVIYADQIKEIEPALSSQYQAALLIKNQARAVSPGGLVKVLTEKFCQLGGELLQFQVKVIKPLESGSWKISIQEESLLTDLLVVAAGAWSVNLLKPLGLNLPLINERGYHLEFHDPGVLLNHSIMEVDSKFVVSSMSNGIRSAGTAEFAAINAKPNYQRAKMLVRQTKRMLPDLNITNTSKWMGTRPSFPDSLPVIDKVSGFPGLFLAFGHSHYGLGMAPKTGRVLADIVSGDGCDIDIKPYSVERFKKA